MLHMYRDVKKTTYTQTNKKLTHPYNHKHTQTNKTPSTCVCGVVPVFGGWARKWGAATFSLVAPNCPREDTLPASPGPGSLGMKQKNQVRARGWETINGKDAVFFCNKKTSKWNIKNELKIVQKEENFIRKAAREKR